jgi:hypothetical protein
MTVPDPQQQGASEWTTNGMPGGATSARLAGPFTLLDFEALQALPDATWLIDGMVPADGLGFIYGASQAGKSFLALDWALSVAAGIPWFGHDVAGGHVGFALSPLPRPTAQGRGHERSLHGLRRTHHPRRRRNEDLCQRLVPRGRHGASPARPDPPLSH